MMPPECHRIERQVVDLAVGAAAHGPALQEAVARSLRELALTELEALFDQVAGPHELLRLDRLEIDLGRIGGRDWEPQFRRRLKEELARGLAQFKPVARLRAARPVADAPATESLQLFLFFLVHGRLPWWGGKPSHGWSDALPDSLDAAGWSALRETARTDARARARLVCSVADEVLDRTVARWSGLEHTARVLERLTPAGLRADTRSRYKRCFWSAVLEQALAGELDPGRGTQLMCDLLALRHAEIRRGSEACGPFPPDEHERLGKVESEEPTDFPAPWHGWLRAHRERESLRGVVSQTSNDSSRAGALLVEPALPSQAISPTGTDVGATIIRMPARSSSQAAARREKVLRPSPDGGAIYLAGAGAILLHPFLEELFRERGLLEGREFRDAPERDRAIQLLGHLVFGIAEVPEYELLLAKLLCGCSFEEPVEPVQPDDGDVAACDALLRAVLGHWTALRSSSPGWLRQQFFLRQGKLEAVDSGWRLTVERHAQDVLLARLPWGIGVVGLPWLRQRVFVHWIE